MVVDTSAVCAIVFDEPDRKAFTTAIDYDSVRLMPLVTLVESRLVVERRKGPGVADEVDHLVRDGEIEVVPLTLEQASVATQALQRFGKGVHPAGLNFGDCFPYALAKVSGESLLFKGDDFRRTDIAAVL